MLSYHLLNITNATELNFSKPEISLTFKITSNEFIKLESAEMKVEEIKLIEVKPNVNTTNTTNTTNTNNTSNKNATSENDNENESEEGSEE